MEGEQQEQEICKHNTEQQQATTETNNNNGHHDDQPHEQETVHRYEQNNDGDDVQHDEKSAWAKRILYGSGYVEGKGLGAKNQGIVSPIEAQAKLGRGGLGHEAEKQTDGVFVEQKHDDKGHVRDFPYQQSIQYIHSASSPSMTVSTGSESSCSDAQLVDGLYRVYCSDEVDGKISKATCDLELLEKLNSAKSVFDSLDSQKFLSVRFKANPYELIGRGYIFQNRAAIKTANLDKVIGLTNMSLLPEENNVLYFADICAGPGGFTEYIYWRLKTERAKGWGFTLKEGSNDWNLEKFNDDAPHDNFELCYGVDGTGNVKNSDNIADLSNHIDAGTNNRGVALLLADGGDSVEGDYNNQEFLMRGIVFGEFLTCMTVLRPGGIFVCKLFDVYSHFSVSILYMLYLNFESFGLLKPLQSRPANSERYVVCKGLKTRKPAALLQFLIDVNRKLNNNEDVAAIVHPSIIEKDETFINYLRQSGIEIMNQQIDTLTYMKKFVEDPYLEIHVDTKRALLDSCLNEWNLPPANSVRRSSRHGEYRGRGRGRGGRGGRGRGNSRGSYDNNNRDHTRVHIGRRARDDYERGQEEFSHNNNSPRADYHTSRDYSHRRDYRRDERSDYRRDERSEGREYSHHHHDRRNDRYNYERYDRDYPRHRQEYRHDRVDRRQESRRSPGESPPRQRQRR